jgi:hypothetical protein
MNDLSKLNVARAKDREAMAKLVTALVQPPWTWERRDGLWSPREVTIELIGPRGLKVCVEFNGDSKQDHEGTFILSWHGVEDPHKLARSFAPSVNEYHWHKATDVCDGLQNLLDVLKTRMASAVDGSAFQTAAFVECGSCDHYHPKGFAGDCRNDTNRFTVEQLDAAYGPQGWHD